MRVGLLKATVAFEVEKLGVMTPPVDSALT